MDEFGKVPFMKTNLCRAKNVHFLNTIIDKCVLKSHYSLFRLGRIEKC
jgi:hypothetical protein